MSMASNFELYGTEDVEKISFGDYVAITSPEGASLKSLTYKGDAIVVTPLPVTDFAFVGSALAPWANRLEDATWSLGDNTYQGEITEPGNHNGLHGLVVARYFEVVAQSVSAVTFRYTFGQDSVYPFQVLFEVTYLLTASGLNVTMSATNRAEANLPISFGSHPYFAVDSNSELKVQARSAAVNNSRQLPVGKQGVESVGLEFGKFKPVADLPLDDCIFDFEDSPVTYLSRPSMGLNVKVWQEEMPYQMLFVRGPRFAGEHPVTVAIEPQSSPANALRTKDDLVWLTVGETKVGTWGVSVESA